MYRYSQPSITTVLWAVLLPGLGSCGISLSIVDDLLSSRFLIYNTVVIIVADASVIIIMIITPFACFIAEVLCV